MAVVLPQVISYENAIHFVGHGNLAKCFLSEELQTSLMYVSKFLVLFFLYKDQIEGGSAI